MDLPEFRNRLGEKLDTTFHPGNREGVLVLLSHGVTGNKDRPLLVALAEGLAARGWPCIRLSWSGNGLSEGDFRESNISKESRELRDILDALPPRLKIAYIGHSMGGAVGVMTASGDDRIRVLVTLAGMIRTEEFCEREFGDVVPDTGFMWDEPGCPLSQKYVDDLGAIGDLFDEVGQITIPWLLIHGTADDVVLIEDSRDAYDTAEEPKRLVEIKGAGHSFDEKSYPRVIQEVGDWLDEYLI
jgi:pimeloyl-ACP methyl ester carboxylesterase